MCDAPVAIPDTEVAEVVATAGVVVHTIVRARGLTTALALHGDVHSIGVGSALVVIGPIVTPTDRIIVSLASEVLRLTPSVDFGNAQHTPSFTNVAELIRAAIVSAVEASGVLGTIWVARAFALAVWRLIIGAISLILGAAFGISTPVEIMMI